MTRQGDSDSTGLTEGVKDRRALIEVVGREISIELALDPIAQRRGLTADAIGRVIDAYESAKEPRQ